MTLETRSLERTFRYNSVDLVDPGAQYSAEEVRDLYTATYPELANAAIEGPEQKEGKLVYTFRRPVGTKGIRPLMIDGISIPTEGVALIAIERLRQIEQEKWTSDHDDQHSDFSLALVACAYAAPFPLSVEITRDIYTDCWPSTWDRSWDKRRRQPFSERPFTAVQMGPDVYIRNLQKAGALIAAEIDRLLRIHERLRNAQT